MICKQYRLHKVQTHMSIRIDTEKHLKKLKINSLMIKILGKLIEIIYEKATLSSFT